MPRLSNLILRRSMKKAILVLALVLMVLCVSSCGSDKPKKAVSENKLGLVKEGTLTVCSDVPYAPFEFYEGSDVVGFDADLMTDIADELRLNAKFIDVDFKDIFEALDDNKCDVIASSVSITEERKRIYNFSDTYYEISQSLLVVNSNSKKFTDLDKLNGKIVGVGTGSTGATFAAENSEVNGYSVRSFTGLEELIIALKKGEIYAALQDYPINR